jgi:hypothetical protein
MTQPILRAAAYVGAGVVLVFGGLLAMAVLIPALT